MIQKKKDLERKSDILTAINGWSYFNLEAAKDSDFTYRTKNYMANILTQNPSLDLVWKPMASYYLVDYIEKNLCYFDWTNIVNFAKISLKQVHFADILYIILA